MLTISGLSTAPLQGHPPAPVLLGQAPCAPTSGAPTWSRVVGSLRKSTSMVDFCLARTMRCGSQKWKGSARGDLCEASAWSSAEVPCNCTPLATPGIKNQAVDVPPRVHPAPEGHQAGSGIPPPRPYRKRVPSALPEAMRGSGNRRQLCQFKAPRRVRTQKPRGASGPRYGYRRV